MIYYIHSKKRKLSMLRTRLHDRICVSEFWSVAKSSMLRTIFFKECVVSGFWRVTKLSMLRTDGNRTEEAYATNYQKQPSVAVFFWLVIIQKRRIQTTAAVVFSPSSIFLQSTKKCYYEKAGLQCV